MSRSARILVLALVGLTFLLAGPVSAQKAISAKAPDGDRVASASGKVIEVRDQKSNKLVWKVTHKSDIQTLVYTPDGKMLASADEDGIVYMEDAATGKLVWRRETGLQGVNVLSFSADGKKVTAKAPGGSQTLSTVAGKKLK